MAATGGLLLLVILGAIAIFWNRLCRFYRMYHIARKLPGPTSYPIIGHAHLFLNKDFLSVTADLGKTFNSVAGLWFANKLVVGVSKPEYAEMILNNKDALDKGFFYHFMSPLFGDGLIAADSSTWVVNRKVVAPTLSVLRIKTYVAMFAEGSDKLVKQWARKQEKEEFEPYLDVSKTTMEFIMKTAMGGDISHWPDSTVEYLVQLISRVGTGVAYRFLRPWLYSDFVYGLTATGAQLKKDTTEFRLFLEEMVKKKTETMMVEEEGFGFLEHVLHMSKGHDQFGEKELMDELSTYLTAGFETTSTAIAFVLVMLGAHPVLQEKVYEEQLSIFGDSDRTTEYEDLSKMQYLEMFIKETMRLFPVITIIGRQITKDVTVGGHVVPEGCFAVVPVYNIHRDPAVWSNPDKFDPEHFSPVRERERNSCSYLPFGAGPRVCLGQKYAMLSMKTLLSTVVRHLRVVTNYGIQDIHLTKDVSLNTKGLHIRVVKRHSEAIP